MPRPDFPHTLSEFQARFGTEDDCRRYLVECRWPDGYWCPRCGHTQAYELATRRLLQCSSCRHQASVTAGTVLHRARVPLHLWFLGSIPGDDPHAGILGASAPTTAWAQPVRDGMDDAAEASPCDGATGERPHPWHCRSG